MSKHSIYFYLPPGILKTDQILGIYYNQDNEDFLNAEIKISRVNNFLGPPNIFKGIWYWNTSEVLNENAPSSSLLTLTINNEKKYFVDLDKLTFISQFEKQLSINELKQIPLFKFKAGIFVREEDFKDKQVSIEKVTVLRNQRRLAYEDACKKNAETQKMFEGMCSDDFQELYDMYEKFDSERKKERMNSYNLQLEKQEGMPVSKYLTPESDEEMQKCIERVNNEELPNFNIPKADSNEIECLINRKTCIDEQSPSPEEIQMFMKELIPIFPVDVKERTFCNIKENDADINSQKMLLFNACHFLVLCSAITGITYDYRITTTEGFWKIEDRITGNEIKRDLMTKTNIFDNQYRDAIISSLKKAAKDLKCKEANSLVDLVYQIQNFSP